MSQTGQEVTVLVLKVPCDGTGNANILISVSIPLDAYSVWISERLPVPLTLNSAESASFWSIIQKGQNSIYISGKEKSSNYS